MKVKVNSKGEEVKSFDLNVSPEESLVINKALCDAQLDAFWDMEDRELANKMLADLHNAMREKRNERLKK